MTQPPSRGSFRISDGVVFRELDGEAVLLNLDSGMYFGLDRVGTRVWQLLEEHRRVNVVIEKMLDEYDVTQEALEADIVRLLDALLEKGLVIREDEGAGAS